MTEDVKCDDRQSGRTSVANGRCLIIFDCDGVLVDSEVIGGRVVSSFLRENGFVISPDEVFSRYTGVSSSWMLADIEARTGRKLPADFAARLQEKIFAAFDRELKAISGVEMALKSLRCNLCVASSSTPERIRRSLAHTGLANYFGDHIFSATQVPRGKPFPDLFLFAAREMCVSPAASIVIEDSVTGVQAAAAAEMFVLGFTGGSHFLNGKSSPAALSRAGAHATFDDMRKLPAIVAEHFSKLANSPVGAP